MNLLITVELSVCQSSRKSQLAFSALLEAEHERKARIFNPAQVRTNRAAMPDPAATAWNARSEYGDVSAARESLQAKQDGVGESDLA